MLLKKMVKCFVGLIVLVQLYFVVNTFAAASLLDVDFDTKTLTSPLATTIAGYSADSTNNTFNTAFTEDSGNKCTKFTINSTTSDYIMLNGASRPATYISGNVKFSFDFKASTNAGSTKNYVDCTFDNMSLGIRFDYINKLIKNTSTGNAFANTSGNVLSFDVWQHFEIQFDTVNSNCNIYINGVKANSQPISVTITGGTDFFRLYVYGAQGTVDYVDNLKLYNLDAIQLIGATAQNQIITAVQNQAVGSTYQWKSSTDNSTFANISGETNATYFIKSSDVGKYLKCSVTGSSTVDSASVGPITDSVAQGLPATSYTVSYTSTTPDFYAAPTSNLWSQAFDGNTTTTNISRRKASSPYWVQVEFNNIVTFDTVVITDTDGRITSYELQVSNDGITWKTAYTGTKSNWVAGAGAQTTSDLPIGTITTKYARFVITATKNDYASIIQEIKFKNTSSLAVGTLVLNNTDGIINTSLYSGKTLSTSVGVANPGANPKKALVILAMYNKGMLTDVSLSNISTLNQNNVEILKTGVVTTPSLLDNISMKVFLWDDNNVPYIKNQTYLIRGMN